MEEKKMVGRRTVLAGGVLALAAALVPEQANAATRTMMLPRWEGAVSRFKNSTTGSGATLAFSFDGPMSETVLTSFLARSVHIMDFCGFSRDPMEQQAWLAFIATTGAKFIGRSSLIWTNFEDDEMMFADSVRIAGAVHAQDPDIMLQCCIFETTSTAVNSIAIPGWVFDEFGIPRQQRNFNYGAMHYRDGRYVDHWSPGASVPDITQLETQLFFYYRARRFIDAGCEAIHFGQVTLMGELDSSYTTWNRLFTRVRNYAATAARRHNVLIDAHITNMYMDAPELWYSASGQFRYEEGASGQYYQNDLGRLNRVDGPQGVDMHHIVYECPGATSVELITANWASNGDVPDAFEVLVSTDGVSWTLVPTTSTEILRVEYTWPNYRVTTDQSLPTGTRFVKVRWRVLQYVWAAQLLDVRIFSPAGGLHDPLDIPSGTQGRLSCDFASYPSRPRGVPGEPEHTTLEVGYLGSPYLNTAGGIHPQGWSTPRQHYLVEIDNYGGSDGTGTDKPYWPWGYDEIAWFAHQPRAYRAQWLQYAHDWITTTDPYGYLQMPGYRTLGNAPVAGSAFYNVLPPSGVFPQGLDDVAAIMAIWPPAVAVTATAFSRRTGNHDQVKVEVTNEDRAAVNLLVSSPLGSQKRRHLRPGKTATVTINTHAKSLDGTQVMIAATTVDSNPRSATVMASVPVLET